MTKIVGILCLVAAMSVAACIPNYSNGTRVGVVTKVSKKGLFVKSWEGEMVSAGGDGAGVLSAPFVFNVDPSVVLQVEEAARSGARVEVTYRQWLVNPLTIEHDHVVTAIAPAQ